MSIKVWIYEHEECLRIHNFCSENNNEIIATITNAITYLGFNGVSK